MTTETHYKRRIPTLDKLLEYCNSYAEHSKLASNGNSREVNLSVSVKFNVFSLLYKNTNIYIYIYIYIACVYDQISKLEYRAIYVRYAQQHTSSVFL
jgi:hypothetical protein